MPHDKILAIINYIEKHRKGTSAFKNWKFGFYIPDIVRAVFEDRIEVEYDENGEILGVMVYEPKQNYLYINHVLTTAPNVLKNMARNLRNKFSYAAVVATRQGKLRIYEGSKLLRLIEKLG